jgi:apolipoprotein N-acyltransferase
VLLILCYPDLDLYFIAWIALVPLLIAIIQRGPISSGVLSFVCGVIFFTGIFRWILDFTGFTLLHQTILGIYVGIFFALFGLFFSLINIRCGIFTALLAAPFLWIPLEYIRANLFFLALPWGLLAHSQYSIPQIIQIASFSGMYGVSFWVVLVNVGLTAFLLPLAYRFKKKGVYPGKILSKNESRAVVLLAVILTIIALTYGQITGFKSKTGKGIQIAIVQGNIEQAKKWDRRFAKEITQTYADLTNKAARSKPSLIVWPEAATPSSITRNRILYNQISHIAKTADTYLLIGSTQHQKLKRGGSAKIEFRNSAFLISPDQEVEYNRYDKIRLMPFGEYLPLKNVIPWSYLQVPDLGSYIPGEEFTVFNMPGYRFSVTICWENLFPDLVRKFVKNGAQFIVNITNEAWFGKTTAPYQFLCMNVFRAVENRVYMVRCANTGVSCFIDPYGRIFDRVRNENGEDIFVRGTLTQTVVPLNSNTIYTRYGDWFVWLCMICSAGFLLAAVFKKN